MIDDTASTTSPSPPDPSQQPTHAPRSTTTHRQHLPQTKASPDRLGQALCSQRPRRRRWLLALTRRNRLARPRTERSRRISFRKHSRRTKPGPTSTSKCTSAHGRARADPNTSLATAPTHPPHSDSPPLALYPTHQCSIVPKHA